MSFVCGLLSGIASTFAVEFVVIMIAVCVLDKKEKK
jgi:hypothetical protein